jgi:calcineurin-like phosphoesterase
MRTGRLPAARLGLGSIFNKDITAGRKILYWGTATWTAGDYTFLVPRTTHYMSTIEAAIVTPLYSAAGAGSLMFSINGTLGTGTASFTEDTRTIKKAGTAYVLMFGSPHTTYIAD